MGIPSTAMGIEAELTTMLRPAAADPTWHGMGCRAKEGDEEEDEEHEEDEEGGRVRIKRTMRRRRRRMRRLSEKLVQRDMYWEEEEDVGGMLPSLRHLRSSLMNAGLGGDYLFDIARSVVKGNACMDMCGGNMGR